MSNLEEKLKDRLTGVFYKGATAGMDYPKVAKPDDYYIEHVAAEIKQAFIDAGWRLHLAENVVVIHQKGLMTGQEWYDRFEKELEQHVRWMKVEDDEYFRTWQHARLPAQDSLDVAKKASRLE